MLNDEALSAPEVAAILHIGRNAVYELAKSGELPSYRIGRKILFGLADVEAYLASKRLGDISEASSLDIRETHSRVDEAMVIGGYGLPSLLLTERFREEGTQTLHCNSTSYESLHGIYEASCDAALIHLYDQRTNSYNIPYIQRLVPGTSVIVFRLAKRQQGFIVASGNPKKITTWGSLLRTDCKLANRIKGSGARILLDEKLLTLEAKTSSIIGYDQEHPTPLLAIQAVAGQIADVTIAAEQLASQVNGVDFIPMQQEWLDLVIIKTDRTRHFIRAMKDIAQDKAFRNEFGRIVQGDATHFGTITYEC